MNSGQSAQARQNAYGFLERVLPLSQLLLSAVIVASATMMGLAALACFCYTLANVAMSVIAKRFPDSAHDRIEVAKAVANVVIGAGLTWFAGIESLFWTFQYLSLFRTFVALHGHRWRLPLSAGLVVAPSVAALVHGEGVVASLSVAVLLAVPTILATVIFTFLRSNLELLQHVERRYERLANVSPVGILELSPHGNCTYANRRWSDIAEIEFAASAGRGWEAAFGGAEEIRSLSQGEGGHLTLQLGGATGEPRWVIAESSAERGATGDLVRYVCSITDITDRFLAERQLARAQKQLVATAHRAGMADVATGVLHNVGNVLNSVNVSVGSLRRILQPSRLGSLRQVSDALAFQDDLAAFLTEDPRGQKIVPFLTLVHKQLEEQHVAAVEEVTDLASHIDHVKVIVSQQQAYAQTRPNVEPCHPAELVEEALLLSQSAEDCAVEFRSEVPEATFIVVDRHKLLHILVNLIKNAREAVANNAARKQVQVIVAQPSATEVRISVIDNGVGIERDNLECIFRHGFSTKRGGHGFGLHNSFLAAKAMNATLSCDSEGPGLGADFTLAIPVADSPQGSSGPPARAPAA